VIAPTNKPPVPTPVSPLRHQSLHTSGEVPARYLKDNQPKEAWRDFVDPNTGDIRTGCNGMGSLKRDWSPRRNF
jgi:hypothetical protein